MRKLIGSPGLRQRLGENAREFVEENCTQNRAARRHMEVFNSVAF